MAITHVASTFDSGTANTSTTTVSKPTGLQVGDVMIAHVVMNDDTAATGPSGWTKYDDDVDGTNHFRSQVWYVVATSTQTGASNFTWTDPAGANSPMWGAISAYRGVDTSGVPIHAASQTSFTTDGATSVTGPSVTTTVTSTILHFRTVRLSGSTTIPTFTGSGSQRFQAGNHGASTSYSGTEFDAGSDTAPGTISGISITASTSPSTSFSRTIALPTLITNVSVNMPTPPDTAVAAYDATVLTGINTQAGVATATAAANNITVGVQGNITPTCAALNASVKVTANGVETATATANAPINGVHFDVPYSRTYVIGSESRGYSPAAESRLYLVDNRVS